jgi:hypothetical protein
MRTLQNSPPNQLSLPAGSCLKLPRWDLEGANGLVGAVGGIGVELGVFPLVLVEYAR